MTKATVSKRLLTIILVLCFTLVAATAGIIAFEAISANAAPTSKVTLTASVKINGAAPSADYVITDVGTTVEVTYTLEAQDLWYLEITVPGTYETIFTRTSAKPTAIGSNSVTPSGEVTSSADQIFIWDGGTGGTVSGATVLVVKYTVNQIVPKTYTFGLANVSCTVGKNAGDVGEYTPSQVTTNASVTVKNKGEISFVDEDKTEFEFTTKTPGVALESSVPSDAVSKVAPTDRKKILEESTNYVLYNYNGNGAIQVKWYNEQKQLLNGTGAAPTAIGTYYVGISAAATTEYTAVSEVQQKVVITAFDLGYGDSNVVIKEASKSKPYNNGNQVSWTQDDFTFTWGFSASHVTVAVSGGGTEVSNNVTVTVTLTPDANYKLTKTEYTFTVAITGLTLATESGGSTYVTAEWLRTNLQLTTIYNGENQTGLTAANLSGLTDYLKGMVNVAIAHSSGSAKNVSDTPVFSVTLTINQETAGGYVFQEGGTTLSVDVTAKINPFAITVTPNEQHKTWKNAAYTDSDILQGAAQFEVSPALPGSDTKDDLNVTLSAGDATLKDAGSYKLTATSTNGNYTVTTAENTSFIIDKLQITFGGFETAIYTGAAQSPVFTSTDHSSYYQLAEEVSEINADTYDVKVEISNSNVEWAASESPEGDTIEVEWTISPRAITASELGLLETVASKEYTGNALTWELSDVLSNPSTQILGTALSAILELDCGEITEANGTLSGSVFTKYDGEHAAWGADYHVTLKLKSGVTNFTFAGTQISVNVHKATNAKQSEGSVTTNADLTATFNAPDYKFGTAVLVEYYSDASLQTPVTKTGDKYNFVQGGTYYAKYEVADNRNYYGDTGSISFTFAKGEIDVPTITFGYNTGDTLKTLTAGSTTTLIWNPANVLTVGSTTVSSSTTLGNYTVTIAGGTPWNAGSFTITLALTTPAQNTWKGGSIENLTYTLQIDRAPLTLTVDTQTVTVGTSVTSFTVSANGLLGTDTLDSFNVTWSSYVTCNYLTGVTIGTNENVSTWNSGAKEALEGILVNYSLTLNGGNLIVNRTSPQAPDGVFSFNEEFDDETLDRQILASVSGKLNGYYVAASSLTLYVYGSNGDSAWTRLGTITLSSDGTINAEGLANIAAWVAPDGIGKIERKLLISEQDSATDDLANTHLNGNVEIDVEIKLYSRIYVTLSAQTDAYNGQPHEYSTTGLDSKLDVTVSYEGGTAPTNVKRGSNNVVEAYTVTLTITVKSDVENAEYYVIYVGSNKLNGSATSELTINPVTVDLTVETDVKTYNGTAQEFEKGIKAVSATPDNLEAGDFSFSVASYVGNHKDVDSYTVNFQIGFAASKAAVAGNYEITVNGSDALTGTLTINKATLTITAEDKNSFYGDDPVALTYKLGDGESIFANDFAVVLSIKDLANGITTTTPANSYTIEVSYTNQELANKNYDITTNDGTYLVKKAVVTVASLTLNAQNVIYSGSTQSYTSFEYTVTLVTSKTVSLAISAVTPSVAYSSTPINVLGTAAAPQAYGVTLSFALAGDYDNDNYTLDVTGVTLTKSDALTIKPATVAAPTNFQYVGKTMTWDAVTATTDYSGKAIADYGSSYVVKYRIAGIDGLLDSASFTANRAGTFVVSAVVLLGDVESANFVSDTATSAQAYAVSYNVQLMNGDGISVTDEALRAAANLPAAEWYFVGPIVTPNVKDTFEVEGATDKVFKFSSWKNDPSQGTVTESPTFTVIYDVRDKYQKATYWLSIDGKGYQEIESSAQERLEYGTSLTFPELKNVSWFTLDKWYVDEGRTQAAPDVIEGKELKLYAAYVFSFGIGDVNGDGLVDGNDVTRYCEQIVGGFDVRVITDDKLWEEAQAETYKAKYEHSDKLFFVRNASILQESDPALLNLTYVRMAVAGNYGLDIVDGGKGVGKAIVKDDTFGTSNNDLQQASEVAMSDSAAVEIAPVPGDNTAEGVVATIFNFNAAEDEQRARAKRLASKR